MLLWIRKIESANIIKKPMNGLKNIIYVPNVKNKMLIRLMAEYYAMNAVIRITTGLKKAIKIKKHKCVLGATKNMRITSNREFVQYAAKDQRLKDIPCAVYV